MLLRKNLFFKRKEAKKDNLLLSFEALSYLLEQLLFLNSIFFSYFLR
jgi:hypothetical protein